MTPIFKIFSIVLLISLAAFTGCAVKPAQINPAPEALQSENSASKMLLAGDLWTFQGDGSSLSFFVQSNNAFEIDIKAPTFTVRKQSCKLRAIGPLIGCTVKDINGANIEIALDYDKTKNLFYTSLIRDSVRQGDQYPLRKNESLSYIQPSVKRDNISSTQAILSSKSNISSTSPIPTAPTEQGPAAQQKRITRADYYLEILDHTRKCDRYFCSVSGRILNKSNDSFSVVTLNLDYFDKSGALVDNGASIINNLAPGGVWKFNVYMPPKAYRYEIRQINGY